MIIPFNDEHYVFENIHNRWSLHSLLKHSGIRIHNMHCIDNESNNLNRRAGHSNKCHIDACNYADHININFEYLCERPILGTKRNRVFD